MTGDVELVNVELEYSFRVSFDTGEVILFAAAYKNSLP